MPDSALARALRRLTPLAALLLAMPAAAQQRARPSLSVVVVEEQSGRPIAEARVVVSGAGAPVFTDGEGRAQLRNVPPGRRLMSISRIGYAPETAIVEFGREDERAEVVLRPQAMEIEGVRVRSSGRNAGLRNAGFYERQRRGHGAFMTREQVERRNAIRALDIFRQVRGFTVDHNFRGEPFLVNARNNCSPLIFVDGALMFTEQGRTDPSDFVHPAEVEAIEAYSGVGTIPAEYNVTGSACGVVLIWTRVGR